jgi:hypothetical protein
MRAKANDPTRPASAVVKNRSKTAECVEIDHTGKVRVIPGKPERSTKSENPWDAVLTNEKRTA